MIIFIIHILPVQLKDRLVQKVPQVLVLNLLGDGNFNVDGKRLTNVGAPTEDDDSTTKKYVDDGMSGKVSTDMVMTLGRPEDEKIVRYLPNPEVKRKMWV